MINGEVDKIEFVQVVNLEIRDSLKNNGTKCLLTFDGSCEDISKVFVDIATAGRHRGVRLCFYIQRNLFHPRNIGQNPELQNRQIVLVISPRDLMQFSTLSAQLGLGSEVVDWYRDATSVPYGQLLIDLSPRTDNRLCFCTNTGSNPSKFYIGPAETYKVFAQ